MSYTGVATMTVDCTVCSMLHVFLCHGTYFMFAVVECTAEHPVGRVFVSSCSGLHAVLLVCRLKQSAACVRDRVTVCCQL